jgi:hypothetical protein
MSGDFLLASEIPIVWNESIHTHTEAQNVATLRIQRPISAVYPPSHWSLGR